MFQEGGRILVSKSQDSTAWCNCIQKLKMCGYHLTASLICRNLGMDWSWIDTCAPCLDPDSVLPWHRRAYSISTFQTHSQYFYVPLGEDCFVLRFVHIFYQQFYPFPHCQECAQFVLCTQFHSYVGTVARTLDAMVRALCSKLWGSHLNAMVK